MISSFFFTFFYQPLMNALILIYQFLPIRDFGLAIITLTVVIRFILYPLSAKGIKSQRILSDLEPKRKEIQEKYKNDKEKQVAGIMNLYKEAKISPISGFLPLLVQFPVMIALYRVLWGVQNSEAAGALYSFVFYPDQINFLFLGVIDLSKIGLTATNGESYFLWGNLVLIVGAAISQFFQVKMMQRKKGKASATNEMAERMQKQMMYFFPFFTGAILLKLPSAIALYWFASTIFSIIQQHVVFKKI